MRICVRVLLVAALSAWVAGCGSDETERPATQPETAAAEPAGPLSFGYKTAWLAVRSADRSAVVNALGLASTREVSWGSAFEAIESRDFDPPFLVFVTPPVDGWTLVVLGHGLEEDTAERRLDFASLSKRFGEVQKFASHRVVEYHEWQRWVSGKPLRRYAWLGESGEILLDDGAPADAERKLLRRSNLDDDWENFELAGEETVMAVAAEWSVDPTTIGDRSGIGEMGTLGEIEK